MNVRILYPNNTVVTDYQIRMWAADLLADTADMEVGAGFISLDEAVALLADAGKVTVHKDTPIQILDPSDVVESLRERFSG